MQTPLFLPTIVLLGIAATASGQQPPEQPATSQPAPVVDIYALVNRLARELDKEFILDPRMRGMPWSSTAGDGADYDSLLALLRSGGYAAIEVGDQVRIVPEEIARQEPSPIVQQDNNLISDHTVITRVIDISGIRIAEVSGENGAPLPAAAVLVPTLRPLMSTTIGSIAAVPGTNKLVIVDRYDNVRRITAIVDELRQ